MDGWLDAQPAAGAGAARGRRRRRGRSPRAEQETGGRWRSRARRRPRLQLHRASGGGGRAPSPGPSGTARGTRRQRRPGGSGGTGGAASPGAAARCNFLSSPTPPLSPQPGRGCSGLAGTRWMSPCPRGQPGSAWGADGQTDTQTPVTAMPPSRRTAGVFLARSRCPRTDFRAGEAAADRSAPHLHPPDHTRTRQCKSPSSAL